MFACTTNHKLKYCNSNLETSSFPEGVSFFMPAGKVRLSYLRDMKLRSFFRSNLHHWTDQELLEAFRQEGRERYFNELFDRYYLLVYGWCLRILKDRIQSKDITIRVFEKASRAIPTTEIKQVKQWLAQVAKNQCIDHLRQQQRLDDREEIWQHWRKSDEQFVENEAFVRLISEGDPVWEEWLQQELQLLTAEQRRCLELFYWQRKTYREIAAMEGFSVAEVKNHLQNGKRQLKKRLANRLKEQEHENK